MRRLNVQFSQIDECIRSSLFAISSLPRNPPLQPAEVLLLQLTMADARRLGRENKRVEFALIYDHYTEDPTGGFSREHWPNADRVWPYILHCSETVATVPFSLENLGLSRDYAGMTNPIWIEPVDEARIQPYLLGRSTPQRIPELVGADGLLASIRNHDRVVELSPVRTTRVTEHQRRLTDPWLGDALKTLYRHRCQVCVNDFAPRYGAPYADLRFITPIDLGGDPVSRNLLVLCPNHNAIAGAARADFDRALLALRFPNGLVERLQLLDHLRS